MRAKFWDEDESPSKFGWVVISGVLAIVVTIVVVGTIFGIDWKNDKDESRGRGDAPVGQVVDQPVDVIQFPDRYSNVAHTCDGHGHRVYVTTKSDQSRFMVVVDDPTCDENESEG